MTRASKGYSRSFRCFPASLPAFLLLTAPCRLLALLNCISSSSSITQLPFSHSREYSPKTWVFTFHNLTTLQDGPSLSSSVKTPSDSSLWSVLNPVIHPRVFCLVTPPRMGEGHFSKKGGSAVSGVGRGTKETHSYRLLYLGGFFKKVCVSALHQTSICLGLFQEPPSLPTTSCLFLSGVK